MLIIAEIHPLTAAELPGSVQTCTKRPGNGPRVRQLLDLTRNLSVPRPGRATLMLTITRSGRVLGDTSFSMRSYWNSVLHSAELDSAADFRAAASIGKQGFGDV